MVKKIVDFFKKAKDFVVAKYKVVEAFVNKYKLAAIGLKVVKSVIIIVKVVFDIFFASGKSLYLMVLAIIAVWKVKN